MRRAAVLFALCAVSMACHRSRETTTAAPDYRLDGAYSFSISKLEPPIYMQGNFVVADSQVFLYADGSCEPAANTPKASDDMRAAWFDCRKTRDGAFLQLRVSQTDPVNKSRWHARMQVNDIVDRCMTYNTRGQCTQVLRARGMKWVDLYGTITVTRGIPDAPRDSARTTAPGGVPRLRLRCDTIPRATSCGGA